jgi:ABC-type Zn uptake system ZnuABC Zn-binding protein ZnuA
VKVNEESRKQLEKLLETYESEVKQAQKNGLLTDSTARTYLLHASNFVKWCKGDFIPGGRNANI